MPSEQEVERAELEAKIFEAYERLPRAERTSDKVDRCLERLHYNCRSVFFDRRRRYLASNRRLSVLYERPQRGGKGRGRLSPDVEAVVVEEVRKGILRTAPISVPKIRKNIASRIGSERTPTVNTIRTRVNALPQAERERHQLTAAQRKKRRRPIKGKTPRTEWPLQRVQIDHTRLDIMLTDQEGRPTRRPFLTIIIDEYTRAIVGYELSFFEPSQGSIARALRCAAVPKDELLDEHRVDFPYPMYGRPERIFVDNGADFHGDGFGIGAREFRMDVEYRRPGEPHTGGIVERFFGTLNGWLKGLGGYCGPSIAKKVHDADMTANKTLEEFERMFLVWLVGEYHNEWTGMIPPPNRMWEEHYHGEEARPLPDRTADPDGFMVSFLPYDIRTIQQYGVVVNRLDYMNERIAELYRQRDERSHVVRIDPQDARHIWFQEAETNVYLRADLQDFQGGQFTPAELRRTATRLAAERGRDQKLLPPELLRAVEEYQQIEADCAKSAAAKRRELSRAERQLEAERKTSGNAAPILIASPDHEAAPMRKLGDEAVEAEWSAITDDELYDVE